MPIAPLKMLHEVDLVNPVSWPLWFKWTVVLTGLTVVFLIGQTLIISPGREQLIELRQEEKNLKEAFSTKGKITAELMIRKQRTLTLNHLLEDALTEFPNKSEMPLLLGSISKIGHQYGLRFVQIKPETPRTERFFDNVPISLVMIGGYEGFLNFAKELVSLPRVLVFEGIEIRHPDPPQEQGDGEGLIIEARVLSYRQKSEGLSK